MQSLTTRIVLWFARRSMRAGFGLFFLFGILLFARHDSNKPGTQPIAFSHSKHVAGGMTCTDCHVGAETQPHALLPALADCLTCHQTALTDSIEEQKIRFIATIQTELHWRPLTRMPPHVYFSHRRHVKLAGMQCVTCHGPMEKLAAPPQRLFRDLSMESCLECHKAKRANTDCNACHH